MAFLSHKTDGEIRVVLRVDTCVKCPKDNYEAYLESFKDGTGDESILKLNGEPTRFVLKKAINWGQKQKLRGKNLKFHAQERELDISVNIAADTVQMHLCGIENPAGIPDDKALIFKIEGGLASNKIMNDLDEAGVLGDLFTAIQNVKGNEDEGDVEKKE